MKRARKLGARMAVACEHAELVRRWNASSADLSCLERMPFRSIA
jgi:hypothetical protein